jgi:hypothetical protein
MFYWKGYRTTAGGSTRFAAFKNSYSEKLSLLSGPIATVSRSKQLYITSLQILMPLPTCYHMDTPAPFALTIGLCGVKAALQFLHHVSLVIV